MNKPIPKSLHTVTAVARLAELQQGDHSDAECVAWALRILGYADDTPDTHGIRAAALKALQS